jgi:hypothetical protein
MATRFDAVIDLSQQVLFLMWNGQTIVPSKFSLLPIYSSEDRRFGHTTLSLEADPVMGGLVNCRLPSGLSQGLEGKWQGTSLNLPSRS